MNLLLFVFLVLSYLSEYAVFLFYSFNLFERKFSLLKTMIVTGLAFLCMLIVSLADISIINIAIYIITVFLLLRLLFQTTTKSAIFHTIIFSLLMILTEFLTLLILQNYTYDYYNEAFLMQNRAVFAIISKVLYFVCAAIVVKLFNISGVAQVRKIPAILYIMPLISFIFVLALIYIWTSDFEFISNLPVNILIPIITVLIVFLNALVYMDEYNRFKKNTETKELQVRLQKEMDLTDYYRTLNTESEYRSTIIHDIKNHLQSIQALNNDENKAITEYISKILELPAMMPSIKRSDNELLNAILLKYADKCRKNSVSYETDIRKGAVSFMSDYDITALFCNLLDNAFEAAFRTDEAFIDLYVEKKEDIPFTIIILRNSCKSEPIIGAANTLVTTKPDSNKHGYGMRSIKNVVDKYDGDMNYYFEPAVHAFVVSISLKILSND